MALFPRLALPLPGKMPVFPRSVPPSLPPYLSWGRCQSFPGPVPHLPPFPPGLPLLGKMPVFLRPVHPLPPFPPSLWLSCLHQKTGGPPNLPNTKAGQSNNPTNYPRQGSRQPPRQRPPRPPRRFILPPGKAITPTTPPARHPQGSSKEEPNPKWVINLSNKPLTPAQRSVLAKGPNFAVTPRQPPNLEYITAIEAACTKLSQQDAEELRADINRVLRSSHPPKPNLTKNEMSALRELKKDRDCIVLTADKGVAMVVMDRQDYINKAKHLLNQNTYKTITKDPTNYHQKQTH